MRGQSDGPFATGRQIRECVGNVEEGRVDKPEGTETYMKIL